MYGEFGIHAAHEDLQSGEELEHRSPVKASQSPPIQHLPLKEEDTQTKDMLPESDLVGVPKSLSVLLEAQVTSNWDIKRSF